ncbi:MAG: hypothetical protein LW720_19180 [Pirellula sp.]|nr:hypothetical protein [Pirellula sp.]
MIHNAITTKRALAVATVAGLTLAVCLATLDGALSADPPLSNEGVRRILVFGDAAPNNPPRQQALMERSIKLVAETFKAHGYEVDLIPTTELGSSIVKERFAHYARTLGINDTFVMYSHSHGNRRGTFFAEWDEYASAILALGRGLVVLAPVSASQLCGPSPEPDVGNPFTFAVTTAARGAADGFGGAQKNGQVEMQELVDYVIHTTREKSRGKAHTPQFAGEFPAGKEFVIFPESPAKQ